MYSMVLLMTMSTSPEAAACHPSNCTGCTGCTGYVATGCTGCSGSCHGGGLFGGCHGGGLFSGCHKHNSCSGCTGCTGYVPTGCTGCTGTAPAPEMKKEMPPPPKDKKGGVTYYAPAAPAFITVNVPADAKVTIDGAATVSTSTVRVFQSRNLNPGTVQYYTFVAEVIRDGKSYTATERVAVEAGAKAEITLTPAVGPAVVSK
jgi:uncharacterized protein (TIGR03000 family)